MCEIVYCKRCGFMGFQTQQRYADPLFYMRCEQCNIPYETCETDWAMDNSETMQKFREENIFNCPEFDMEQYKIKEENEKKWMQEIVSKPYIPPQKEPPEVRCPKCGSTQIQAVPRRWSILTGFLTSKVNRFCLNCKHKF